MSFYDTFWTILNRFRSKNFFRKIFENFQFFGDFWPKKCFFEFFGIKFLISFSLMSVVLYSGHFALLYASLGRTISTCAAVRSNIYQNGPKIEVFWIFRELETEKLFFYSWIVKRTFLLFFWATIHLSRLTGTLVRTSDPICTPPDSRWLIESDRPDNRAPIYAKVWSAIYP